MPSKVDDSKRSDPKIAAGRVLAQEPAAGSTARQPADRQVWVSTGPRATTSPNSPARSERRRSMWLTQTASMKRPFRGPV